MSDYTVKLIHDGDEIDVPGYSEVETDGCGINDNGEVVNTKELSFGRFGETVTIDGIHVIGPDGDRFTDGFGSAIQVSAGTNFVIEIGELRASVIALGGKVKVPASALRELADEWHRQIKAAADREIQAENRVFDSCAEDLEDLIGDYE